LLKKKRLDVHARIADVLTDAFSDQVARKPEFLAHHLTQAATYERATPYWIEAGERALRQVALLEAIGHLTTALRINGLLPQSAERDVQELTIRMLLAKAYQCAFGWPTARS
jgi:predicted ATPase